MRGVLSFYNGQTQAEESSHFFSEKQGNYSLTQGAIVV